MTITCGFQTTGVVTMAMKVLHNTCKMCIRDLPVMNALIPQACDPWASRIHIKEIPHAHVITIACNTFTPKINISDILYCKDYIMPLM